MPKGRNELKKHVRAAKEWLGEAEQSLDMEENVRGDLNVMLAKAELQHASEITSETQAIMWLKRLLPIFVAAGLVAGWYFLFDRPKSDQIIVKPMPIIVEKPVERNDKPVPEEKEEQTEMNSERDIKEKEPETVQETQIPAEDMQRLMCTAGQSLRAQ